ncbi:hypothetical protein DFQ27_006335 [Actinomortierella ambigua]|uniref:Uncharacterized protein n=1 Tax=Actinomortierella ambigua TaxID=1343610 RepID=A0A9P6PXX6_9FUNG|nr:hypothetical protein DFQ27_006335 [Actinomortierella ambigua]
MPPNPYFTTTTTDFPEPTTPPATTTTFTTTDTPETTDLPTTTSEGAPVAKETSGTEGPDNDDLRAQDPAEPDDNNGKDSDGSSPHDTTTVTLTGKPGFGKSETSVQPGKCYIIDANAWQKVAEIIMNNAQTTCTIYSDDKCHNVLVSSSDSLVVPEKDGDIAPNTFKCVSNA